ncbi:creatininase family protein [Aquibium sp. A9E412]|uniref:creatininase family protein n=1 Tax=Aquibium sp. A9E412 TaxID=2976767 RepID=UPI0025B0E6E7|nr:creatininase family protein [Aquibium sp. A9E412]MDN2566959.1 creatininase family protein [Aquibium sp. A9E412]
MTTWIDAREATLPEIAAFAERYPFAILPVGSFEQHGPHLPLDTDNRIAERMALETARRSVGMVLPVLNVGYAWVWRGHPGTLTFRFDTYMAIVRDIAESLAGWGVKALFVLSAHGSNPQLVKHAIRELIHERHDIRVLNSLYLGLDTMLAEAQSHRWANDIHAEEIETALMLAIAPELVHMERAAADYPPVPDDYGRSELSMGHIMRSGVFGDPTQATAEKGRRWLETGAARTAELWLGYLARHGLYRPEGA